MTPATSPVTLEYPSPENPEDANVTLYAFLQFFFALVIGVAASGIIWWGAFRPPGTDDQMERLILLVPGLKVLAALPLLLFRRSRPAAAGLLLSLPIGVLIFFGVCAATWRL